MIDENWFTPGENHDDDAEELSLEFDASHDPEAVWEWNGQEWVAVAA